MPRFNILKPPACLPVRAADQVLAGPIGPPAALSRREQRSNRGCGGRGAVFIAGAHRFCAKADGHGTN